MRSRAQSDKTGGENLDRELPRDKKESENDQLKAVGVAECLQGNKRKTCRRSQSQKRVQLSSVWKQQISSWDPGAAANTQVRKRLGTGQKPQTSRPSMWHTATDAPGGLKRQDRGGPKGRRKAISWQQGKLRETEKKQEVVVRDIVELTQMLRNTFDSPGREAWSRGCGETAPHG